ncbi:MAG: J domain-containing protein [Ktedonobacterales bacterium]|jgi:hypothetical protein
MEYEGLTVAYFEALADGYLIALAARGSTLSAALKVILALDPWQRRWIAEERAWWIADDAISLLARRLPPVAEAFARWQARPLTLDDLLGSEYRAREARVRYRLLVPREVATAYATLGLAPGASGAAVKAARRSLARQHHPDAGGDHGRMAAINRAADIVLGWMARERSTSLATR